jgi:hypothetical protein
MKAIACLALALLGAAASRPALRRVPEDYPTVQAAIDAAAPGDVVRIARGTYDGPFRLAKTLTLASAFPETSDPEDAARTVLRGGGPILTVSADAGPGTTIRGLTFLKGSKALVLDGPRRVDVLDCRFLDNGGDQLSFEHAGGSVRNCTFRNAGDDNIDIDGASDPVIEHNVLDGASDDNIEMRFQPYAKPRLLETVIRDNLISGAKGGDGIQLIDYAGASARVVRIERNVITRAAWAGIGSMEDGHTKQSDFPDAPRGSPQVEKIYVLHNTIVGNRYGITGGHAMLLLNNIVADCRASAVRRVKGASAIFTTCLWNNGADYDDCVSARGDLKQAPNLDPAHRLRMGSPCSGAGLASAAWNGETVAGGRDLGAFPFAPDGLPVVSVAATDPDAAEPADPGTFTIERSGSTTLPLRVAIRIAGTASPGADYEALPAAVILPPGASSVAVAVRPADDRAEETEETVELALLPDPAYALGRPSTAVVRLADDDAKRPTVTVLATTPTAAERGSKAGVFTITRTGPTEAPLEVKFSLGGEATNGVDYAARGPAVTIPAGASSGRVTIVPVDDRVADEEEVTLTLVASPAYLLGTPSGATITIDDDD